MPGEGSLYQRKSDGRWVAALRIGPRGADRKFVRYAPLRDNSRKTAQRLLREMLDAHGDGRDPVPSRMTLGAYLPGWREVYATKVGPAQLRNVDSLMRTRILPALGGYRVSDITPALVERFLVRLPLSDQSVRHAYNALALVWDAAVRDGLATRNVVRILDRPTVRDRRERVPWTVDEARRFIEAVRDDRYFAAYLLAMYPGPRQGEILALTWADLDLDTGSVRIASKLARRDGRYVREETKTRHAYTAALSVAVRDALRAHRARQLAERVAAGVPTDDGLVFVTEAGRPVNGSWLTHHFQRLVADTGLPAVDFHSLRHLATSLDVAAGSHPRVAMAQRGHRSITTSMDRYAHIVDDDQRRAAMAVDALLGRAV